MGKKIHLNLERSETVETLPIDLQSRSEISNLPEGKKSEVTELKKELGLFEGCAVIIGCIIGSGIFVSPKGVLANTGSIGLSLIVWILCGLLSTIGALCYAELGTMIPHCGGDYVYIFESLGSLPAYLFLWASSFIFVPTTNAIMALTFANYVIQPLFPGCNVPESAVSMLAAVTICFITYINCCNTKFTHIMQKALMFGKLGASALLVIFGALSAYNGNSQDLSNPFQNSKKVPGEIAASFYTGMFAYSGWNYLNFMTGELKEPQKNLPRAIYISLPTVTCIYVLINIAYLTVLSPEEMLAADAIAVTFSNRVIGGYARWIIPLLVALSAFGSLSIHIMTSARICFAGARAEQFPELLGMISVNHNTPITSLLFLGLLSLIYLCTTDIFSLIEYTAFVESLFILITISGMLYMRFRNPERERPIRPHIMLPIVFAIVCGFLVFMPIYVRPWEVGMGLAITISGIPVYFLFVRLEKKPRFWKSSLDRLTKILQYITVSLREEKFC